VVTCLTGGNSYYLRSPWHNEDAVHKRLPFALVCYAVLALLAWFTLGTAGFYVGGRLVEMRTAVCIFLGGLTLKTLIAYKAGW